jgi:hypothetical protein
MTFWATAPRARVVGIIIRVSRHTAQCFCTYWDFGPSWADGNWGIALVPDPLRLRGFGDTRTALSKSMIRARSNEPSTRSFHIIVAGPDQLCFELAIDLLQLRLIIFGNHLDQAFLYSFLAQLEPLRYRNGGPRSSLPSLPLPI